MLHPLWYTLLATYISAHTVFLPMRPLEQPGIVIRADCFNINPCPDRNGNRWTLLKRSWPATTTKFRVSRLKIRTRYINDLTASSSLSSTSATTPAPPPPSILTTLISSPASATTTINTAARITDSTPSINTVITAENTEPQSPLTTVTSENPSSPSINTTNAEQYTPRLEKAPRMRNPCAEGEPFRNENGKPVSCNPSAEQNGGCPDGYWCHVGVTYVTTVCCPALQPESRCELQMSEGIGGASIPRWFFNPSTGQCSQFTYKGLRGNANNFATLSECTDFCIDDHEEEMNPCKYGEPAKGFDDQRLACNSPDSLTCPKGYFCHIGATQADTVCCERSGLADSCSLSVDEGQGNALIKRFYYDDESQQCKEFSYRGLQGNENNFLTYSDCRQKCMRWDMICEISPRASQRHSCSADRRDCGDDQWCHIGANSYSTVCCAGALVSPCELPLMPGEGNETMSRWFADPSDHTCTRECRTFTYKGLKGNQNNFLTKADCERQCKRACEDPCSSGLMLLTAAGAPHFCSPASLCPKNYWCHIGAQRDSTVCCPDSGTSPCQQPMAEGAGNSSLLRWYFDQSLHRCSRFYYRGKGGNQNSFLSENDCKKTCPAHQNPCAVGEPLLINNKPKICSPEERCPQTHYCHVGSDEEQNSCCPKNGNPCDQPLNEGEGQLLMLRYYYDKESHRCREFVYHGMKGNANNFLTEQDCESMCPVVPNPCVEGKPLMSAQNEPVICGGSENCPNDYYCHIGSSPETTNCCPGSSDACSLPLVIGKGMERLDRWYFDNIAHMCHKFVYRGLEGNANNFISQEACRQSCKEMNPCAEGTPLTDQAGERVLCSSGRLTDCPSNYYCHIGSSSSTTLCCPRLGYFFSFFRLRPNKICGNPCEQMQSIGYGGKAIPRWSYDVGREMCIEFSYGGLGGNENNFISKKYCEESCKESQEYCPHGDPLMEASGQVLATCGIDRACPVGFICNMNVKKNTTACCQDPANFCLQPMDPGQCTDFEKRYGYEPELDNCVEYDYGGCGGSLNNFDTLEKCTEICCKNE